MVIQMTLRSELGEFTSEKMDVTYEQYIGLTEVSKTFYMNDNGFDMWLEDGFFVAPPFIVQRSLLLIKIINDDKDEIN